MDDVPAPSRDTPLVGRDAEQAALAQCLARAERGSTRVAVVGGEAGVGKTRLVSELAAGVAEHARVLWGQCIELGSEGVPYTPLVSALRSLVRETGAPAVARAAGPGRADLARLLPELGTAAEESDVGRGRLFEAVAALLEQAAAERPLLVVVEDLHWADPSTRDLLGFLVRGMQDTRVLLVLTYRTDEMHRTHPLRPFLAELERSPRVSRLTVGRLDRDEVRALLTHLRGEPPPPALLDHVVDRSDGVPFFVEELAEIGASDGRHPLPETLRDLLLVRIEALPEVTQQVLRVAAAGGTHVSHAALAAVAGLTPAALDHALRAAVAGHVLVVDRDRQGYAFRHALMREAVHDDLLPGEHARLHAQWAQALQQSSAGACTGSVAVEVAHHWYAAWAVEEAFAASLRAADETRALYAPREEMLMLDRALELWDRVGDAAQHAGSDRVGLLERAGTAAWHAGELERAVSFIDAALRAVPTGADPRRRAHLLVLRATYTVDASDEQTLQLLHEAIDLCPAEQPSPERGAALAMVAAWHMLRDDWAAAAQVAEQARVTARQAGDLESEANALTTRALAEAGLGDVAAGLESFEESRRTAERAGDEIGLIRYRANLGDLLLGQGRYREAAEVSRLGRAHADSRGLSRNAATFLAGNEAEALVALGAWEEAAALLDRALGQDPPRPSRAHLQSQRTLLLLHRGAAEADQAVESLLPLASWFPGQSQYVLPIAQAQAEGAVRHGEPAQAVTTLVQALRATQLRAHASAAWPTLHLLARALAQTDPGPQRDEAAAVLEQARRTFAPGAGSRAVWEAMVAAELAAESATAWQAAVAGFDDPSVEGPVLLHAYARYRWAGALVAAGDRSAAGPQLERAAELARRLGAGPLLTQVMGLARRARLPVGGGQPPAPDPFGLTPREQEVLDLLVEGRSNPQIADALFISAKTASVHVSNILAKLGVSSRGEAVARAHADGLVGPAEPGVSP